MADNDFLAAGQSAIWAAGRRPTLERGSIDLLEAVAYGLLAIAERMPPAAEMRCCHCSHIWRQAFWPGASAICPLCGSGFVTKRMFCGSCDKCQQASLEEGADGHLG